MPHPSSDHNLLLGILALQFGLVSKERLIDAMGSWANDKSQPLDEIFVRQGALREEGRAKLLALVQMHLELHGNAPEKSLAALSSVGGVQEQLAGLRDSDLNASLVHVSQASRAAVADPFRTLATVGQTTSDGLRFRILRPHARGGLGEISVAQDTELHREVALKEIQIHHADNLDSRGRFLLEAQITGGLEHPGIVPVYGFGAYPDGRPFYAMRFIRGDSLKDALDKFHRETSTRGKLNREAFWSLPFRQLLGRFVDVCNAVAYAHARGILHRDLKPGNIMLGKYGETLVVDWGLAKPVDHPIESADVPEPPLTLSSDSTAADSIMGSAIGTPAYMSPEQAAGRLDQMGPATDIYCLGTTLFHLLTGQSPHQGDNQAEILGRIQAGNLPTSRSQNRNVPPALDAICRKAMALKPSERYATCLQFAADIEHWLADEPVSAYPDPLVQRLARWARQHRTLVTAAAVLLISAVAALSVGMILLGRKQQEILAERNLAQKARAQAEIARDASQTINRFYENYVLAAARPKGWNGGAGKDVSLKEALEQAAPKIDEAFAKQPELAATVRNTLGMTYFYLGRFPEAAPLLDKAHSVRLSILGADHPDTLTSLFNRALEAWKLGELPAAETLARQAWQARARVLGKEHEDTLFAQLNLGLFLFEQRKLDEAEKILRDGAALCEQALGPDHHHTHYANSDLALVMEGQNKRKEAIELDRKALAGRSRTLGSDHPDTLRSTSNLAYKLLNDGQLEEGERLAYQALEGRKRVLGEDHEETFWAQRCVAYMLQLKGKLPEAETLDRKMVQESKRVFGAEHSETLLWMDNLAYRLRIQGKNSEAEPIFREIIDIKTRTLGPNHPNTLTAINNLAVFYGYHQQLEDAEPLFRRVAEGLKNRHGPEHPDTLFALNNLAVALRKLGRTDEGVRISQEILDCRLRLLGPDNLSTLDAMCTLAFQYRDLGKFDEAEVMLAKIVAGHEKSHGEDNAQTLEAVNDLAVLYEYRNQLDRAEPLRRKILSSVERQFGSEHQDALLYRGLLAELLRE